MIRKLTTRAFLLALLLLVAVLVGVVLADDYGQSWDDPTNAAYGQDVLRAYGGSEAFWNHRNLPYYGPAHFAGSAMLVGASERLPLRWHAVDVRHAANYLAFLLGIVGFYLMASHLFDARVALMGTLLLATQPMFFGHGFINQKDMPFAAFFALAMGVGFQAVGMLERAVDGEVETPDVVDWVRAAAGRWGQSPRRAKFLLLATGLVFLEALVEAVGQIFLLPSFLGAVARSYEGTAAAPVQWVFNGVATDAYKTPVNLYLSQAEQVYYWTSVLLTVGTLLPVYAVLRRWYLPGGGAPQRWKDDGGLLLLIAGVVLGLATSMRVIGPFAGVLVSGYLVLRTGTRHLGKLLLSWGAAGVVSYLTWPTLWGNPLRVLFNSLFLMSDYEVHELLYRGEIILSTELPWHYLPTLFSLKFTLPAMAAVLLGAGLAIRRQFDHQRGDRLRGALPLVALWIVVPAGAVAVGETPIYDNLRHLLFIIPAFFLLGCLGLQWLVRILERWSLPAAAVGLLLLPSLVGIVTLHPYEYAYYNVLIGGVKGASGRYALDYWCTSFREAINHVNGVAPAGASLMALGPERVVRRFVRSDIEMLSKHQTSEAPDFMLTCSRALVEDVPFSNLPVQFTVSRGGAIFAEVRNKLQE